MMPNRSPAAVVAAAVVFAAVFAVGCRDDSSDSAATDASATGASAGAAPDVTICDPSGTAQPEENLPAVGEIPVAIDALEQQLGGPQQYYEVNATARVVNLFVALNDSTLVQPWLYVDGALTSQDAQAASGGTFTGDELDFVPSEVLTKVRKEVPEAVLESFYVNGDGKGNLQYGVLTSAQCGGGLDVVVGADGAVKSVDPVN
jgi:hypothetical protein